MIPRSKRMYYWTGGLLWCSWLTLAVLDPSPGQGITKMIGLGYFFGSLFAHGVLAAAWSAFGPGSVKWRVPLSLLWIISLAFAVAINLSINGGPNDGAIVVGSCLLGLFDPMNVNAD